MLRLNRLIGLAYAFALVGFAIPWISVNDERQLSFLNSIRIGFAALALWIVVCAMTAILFRWRALWLLPGAAAALWWPLVAVGIVAGCWLNAANCP